MDTHWLQLEKYDFLTNHLKLHKSHSDSFLPTVSGGIQCQKLFVSQQKLHNLQSSRAFILFSVILIKAWDAVVL